jgi:hypothetical protein
MHEILVSLPEAEFIRLNSLYPPSTVSAATGNRAVAIVQFHFRSRDPNCEFTPPTRKGIDLRVVHSNGTDEIEVKGTAEHHIAWGQLKVSGRPSYDNLTTGTPLYRVTRAYERDPLILVMTYPADFDIAEEVRWTLKRRRS